DAVELGHGAGAVQGDAGLRPLLVRLHQDGGDDARAAAAGRVDVDLAERIDDVLQLRHGTSPVRGLGGRSMGCSPQNGPHFTTKAPGTQRKAGRFAWFTAGRTYCPPSPSGLSGGWLGFTFSTTVLEVSLSAPT